MVKSIFIPAGLWHFIGSELITLEYVNNDSITSEVFDEPAIRWLLLNDDEWNKYSEIITLLDPVSLKSNETKAESPEINYLNVYVRETFRKKAILERFPETERMNILEGFIGFDNVILMSERKTEELFKEAVEQLNQSGKTATIAIDFTMLAMLVKELIGIYLFRLGHFRKEIADDGIIENMILLRFLALIGTDPQNFKLSFLQKSSEGWKAEEQLRENILKAMNQTFPDIILDDEGKEVAKFSIGKLFRIEEGSIRVNFGSFGLKTDGNFVGLSHILYSPSFFGAKNVQDVLDSWNWLLKKINVSEVDLQMALEACSLSVLLASGIERGKDVFFFSLIVDLHQLDLSGIDTIPKTEEFGREIRGNLREFEKLKDKNPWKGIIKLESLREYLSNVSWECRLARIANNYGFKVQFGKPGKNPDLIINAKTVEVKNLSSYSLSNPINDGMKRHPDIIAIKVDSLKQREIPNLKSTWLGTSDLKEAIKTAVTCGKDGSIVLLFMTTAGTLKGRLILLKQNITA
ncbi:MAG: hypothetical protein ABSG33_02710 [Candidatus Bathyarchaeia archaeon]|jgi:hypothetical protein